MRNRDPMRPRQTAAVGAVLLALALGVFLSAGHAFAAEDEEEDVPLDTKIFRQIMKDWGLRRDDDAVGNIEYHERSPLVLPPSRNLPKPEDETTVTKSAAWPKDPDVNRRKRQTAAEKAKLKSQTDIFEEEKNPLRPSELNKGGRTASSGTTTISPNAEDGLNPLTPGQLGSKSLFSTLFSGFGSDKPEVAPFTGERPRTKMTEPPPGYQTPSPNQPYGLGKEKWVNKPSTAEERAEAPK
jgi:hypothetical protein